MLQRLTLSCVVVLATLASAGCGDSTSANQPSDGRRGNTTTTLGTPEVAGVDPSKASKMICESEVAEDIARVVGFEHTVPLTPSWVDHNYSCDYVYEGGTMTLSVKELSSLDETTAYFDSLAETLGGRTFLENVGEDAYSTTTGSAVVRKDYKVLLVDVSGLPERFGQPVGSRGTIATAVALAVLGCWIEN